MKKQIMLLGALAVVLTLVITGCKTEPDEEKDGKESAIPLPIGVWVNGRQSNYGGTVWYTFNATAGNWYFVHWDASSPYISVRLLLSDERVTDEGRNDNSGEVNSIRLDGTAYVTVERRTSGAFSYKIMVEEREGWRIIKQVPVDSVYARSVGQFNTDFVVSHAITDTVVDVAEQMGDMNTNIEAYRMATLYGTSNLTGLPNDEFLQNIEKFQGVSVRLGHTGINNFLPRIFGSNVADEDKELFDAYVDAYRGVNLLSAKQQGVKDDYTTTVNLGNGPVSIGDLLQNVNTLTGTETYSLSGQYPTRDTLHSAASTLLPDDVYGALGADVLTNVGNFEQLLGLLQRAHGFGMDTTFSADALRAIALAGGVGDAQIEINKIFPDDELTQE
jgi:hypothetical protein